MSPVTTGSALDEHSLTHSMGRYLVHLQLYHYWQAACALFELDTDDERTIERFTEHIGDHSYSVSLAVSLGHAPTLMENPYNMTHLLMSEEEKAAMGLKQSGMRLSIGLEDAADITHDLKEGLDKM